MSRWLHRLALLLACLLVLPAVHAREEILSFDADIQVRSDGSMQLTERIRVRAEGDQIKRGIYRDFPTDYRDRLNNRIQVGFEVARVMRDGQAENYRTERQANGVRVYIGKADRILPPGEYSYSITYLTTRQLGFFDDFDELYWNVTGNGWAFPILSATATVKLPPGVPSRDMAIEGYTGPVGAQGQAYVGQISMDSEAFIRTTGPLAPGEGLTLVLSWPKGVVYEPTPADKVGYLMADNRGLLIALAVLIGLNLSSWLARQRGLDGGLISDLLPILVLASVVGARMYYVAFEWRTYQGSWWDAFAIWRGGTPVGMALQEIMHYCGVESDHIAIRTSSYVGVDERVVLLRHAEQLAQPLARARESSLGVDRVEL